MAKPKHHPDLCYMTTWPNRKKFYHFKPDTWEEAITIEDIAHHMSLQCRYNGGVPFHYSVALHSLYCVEVYERKYKNASRKTLRTMLLHDAGETYWADLHAGMKRNLSQYMQWLSATEAAVARKFDCWTPEPVRVKKVDGILLSTELRELKGEAPYKEKPLPSFTFEELTTRDVEERFLDKWEALKP